MGGLRGPNFSREILTAVHPDSHLTASRSLAVCFETVNLWKT